MRRNGLFLAMMLAAAVVLAGPPVWKWRAETFPATSTGVYPVAEACVSVSEVRAQWIGGGTNSVSVGLDLIAPADAFTNALATFSASSGTASDRFTNLCWRAEATNATGRIGDRFRVRSTNVTNGVVTVGYFYAE